MSAGMPQDELLATLSNTVQGLLLSADQLEADALSEAELGDIIQRGEFRPTEDESIGFWFARFLSVREIMWNVIEDVLMALENPRKAKDYARDLRFFLLGYAAVCLLIRIDRFMLFKVASHSVIQRKLNEAFPEYRIPRKQYTKVFSAFVDQGNVLEIRNAMKFARVNRRKLLKLKSDDYVGFIATQLRELESSLNPSKLSYFLRAWSYVSHKWRRRGVVSAKNMLAALLEGFGRTASEFLYPNTKRVSDPIRREIGEFLQPGDVIVTRHAKALTNLFLPGFWPHAALYIGTPEQRESAGIRVDEGKAKLWVNDICVLEARKDGVRLRPLADTLSVDVFVVLRPGISADGIAQAIDRAVLHEGKLYNFDFDFFNSDRLVCTEVVYRAFDGIDGVQMPLFERGGRKTLSAEDLLDFALDENAFLPAAIFGVDGCKDRIVFGSDVREILISTYRKPGQDTV